MDLKEVLQRHEQLPFPRIAEDEPLADWISTLAELDAYYVGLAYSLTHHVVVKEVNLEPLSHLRQDFEKMRHLPGLDETILHEYENYLISLEQLVKDIVANI